MSTYDHDPRARRQVLASAAPRRYRVREWLADRMPDRLHPWVCPFCQPFGWPREGGQQ